MIIRKGLESTNSRFKFHSSPEKLFHYENTARNKTKNISYSFRLDFVHGSKN